MIRVIRLPDANLSTSHHFKYLFGTTITIYFILFYRGRPYGLVNKAINFCDQILTQDKYMGKEAT